MFQDKARADQSGPGKASAPERTPASVNHAGGYAAQSQALKPAPPKAKPGTPPAAIFSYYEAEHRTALTASIKRAKLPPGTPTYMGTYGVSEEDSEAAHSLSGGQYAPGFALVRDKFPGVFAGREKGVKGDKAHAGEVPELKELAGQKNAASAAYAWGKEIGRRFRDKIREAQGQGIPVETWQLDEVWPSASKSRTGPPAVSREYIRGAIEGLAEGRAAMHDQYLPGLVHVAHPGDLARLGNSGEMAKFWKTLDEATLYVLGEEYPPFKGGVAGAKAAADRADAGVDALQQDGKHGKSIAKKYVACLTPGYRHAKPKADGTPNDSLGGERPGQSAASVDAWRATYMNERMHDGVAGIEQFNWRGKNERKSVMDKTTKQMSQALRQGPP